MKRLILLVVLALAIFHTGFSQMLEPVKWRVELKDVSASSASIVFTATIERGWHVYAMDLADDGPIPTSFVFENIEGARLAGNTEARSPVHSEYDPYFEMTLAWYSSRAIFVQKITYPDAAKVKIAGYIRYMTCNEQSCLPPTNEEFSITLPAVPASDKSSAAPDTAATESNPQPQNTDTVAAPVSSDLPDLWQPVVEELQAFETTETSLWWIFLAGLLAGFLALFTPCVWPVIPMTVSYFLKRSGTARRGRRDATFYGLSIVVVYVGLGLLITAIFGGNALNNLSTNAVFNIFLFVLLLVFAVSFFGAFEITIPSSWTNKIDAKAEQTAGFLGILLMAFVLALVSFSCTGPIIGALLASLATSGEILAPAVGMLGFAIALAIPFSLFAFFPSMLKKLPKSGGWMNTVKVSLAFIELAFALKFLSVADLAYGWRLLDRETFLALWIVLFALLGFYLLGKIRFPHDEESRHTSVFGFFTGTISLAFALYMLPGLWGAPLTAISAFPPPSRTQDFNLYKAAETHAEFDNYEAAMAAAAETGKPVLIDFTGFGCVNCRKMEASVWIDPSVKRILEKDFILVSLWVDDKTPLETPYEATENGKTRKIRTTGDKWSYLQRVKFGANAQPYYVILDEQGKPLTKKYVFDEDARRFADWLQTGLENYRKNKKTRE